VKIVNEGRAAPVGEDGVKSWEQGESWVGAGTWWGLGGLSRRGDWEALGGGCRGDMDKGGVDAVICVREAICLWRWETSVQSLSSSVGVLGLLGACVGVRDAGWSVGCLQEWGAGQQVGGGTG
jgi:hypothetical protein